MARLLRVAPAVFVALGLLSLAAAFGLERFASTEVRIIVPASEEEVNLNRSLWVEGDPVVDIYGVPSGDPVRVLFVSPDRIIHPAEDPALALLPVDKQAGENPLQVQTAWFFAWRAAAGFAAAAVAAFAVSLWLRRRRAAAASA